MKKITKEELIEKVAELEHDNSRMLTQDQLIRREFAKAFGWKERQNVYEFGEKVILPSWEQIFVEVGKLLNGRDWRVFEGNISELEFAVEEIKRKINEPNNPPLNL